MEYEKNIEIILRQTNLNSDEIKELLIKNNNNVMDVLKIHYNINVKENNKINSKSLNQEIYKQLRNKLYLQVDNVKKV